MEEQAFTRLYYIVSFNEGDLDFPHIFLFNIFISWCVSQEDSIMTYPENSSYDDVKCFHEEYIDFVFDDVDCLIPKDKIIAACEDKPPLLIHSCQMECCEGGCDAIDQQINEIETIKTLGEDKRDILYDIDFDDQEKAPLCSGDFRDKTGETVCLSSSGSVVKPLHQSIDIPDGEHVIYGISFADATDDDHAREVSFRVENPFQTKADTYVRYEKKVGFFANDPTCEPIPDLVPGCVPDANEILPSVVLSIPVTNRSLS